jgi:hypothetical protein
MAEFLFMFEFNAVCVRIALSEEHAQRGRIGTLRFILRPAFGGNRCMTAPMDPVALLDIITYGIAANQKGQTPDELLLEPLTKSLLQRVISRFSVCLGAGSFRMFDEAEMREARCRG